MSRIKLRGWIANGTLSPLQKGDIIYENGKIIAFAPEIIGSVSADKQLEFKTEIIAPGFIDVHGHSDLSILAAPEGFSKRAQGVAVEIGGNCGLSAFPVTYRNREHLEELYANYRCPLKWNDYQGYIQAVKNCNSPLKFFALCGHNTLRGAVAGYEKEHLNASQLKEMKQLLAQMLSQGALGLSTGLLYVPGKFSTPGEIVELMKVVADVDKIYATHLRSEGDMLLESLTETIELAIQAGLKRLQISHFKTAGKDNWIKLPAAVEIVERARRNGMEIFVDRYPYIESLTQMSVVLPGRWSNYGDGEITRLLKNEETRKQLYYQLNEAHDENYWKRLRLGNTNCPKYIEFIGKMLMDISPDPAETVVNILACDGINATVSAAGMSEDNLEKILSLEYCLCGSDGNALPIDYSLGRAHPRAFGAAAMFLRRQLDMRGNISQAVYPLTGLAAKSFNLENYGIIAPGAVGGITVFNPDTVNSKSTFSSPHTPPEGIVYTLPGS